MNDCPHTVTQRRSGEDKASYCLDCGEKVYDVDPRPCGECLDCRKDYRLGYCARHAMLVTLDMNVTYKVSEGTCFRK